VKATNTLSWDIEQAMTAFQVNPEWYERYWFGPTSSGSVDFNLHRERAARERALARQQAGRFLLTVMGRGFQRFVFLLRGRGTPVRHIRTEV
jgi:hypothetical protein